MSLAHAGHPRLPLPTPYLTMNGTTWATCVTLRKPSGFCPHSKIPTRKPLLIHLIAGIQPKLLLVEYLQVLVRNIPTQLKHRLQGLTHIHFVAGVFCMPTLAVVIVTKAVGIPGNWHRK